MTRWVFAIFLGIQCSCFAKIVYPKIPKSDSVDCYHDILIEDPYRSFEELPSFVIQKWVEEQNALTQSYFQKIPLKETLADRLEEFASIQTRDLPKVRNGKWFWVESQNFLKRVCFGDFFNPTSEILINFAEKDPSFALENYFPSPDGNLIAYSISQNGSDWQTLKVRNVETGEDADTLEWVKYFPVIWDPEINGFFYVRYDPIDRKEIDPHPFPKVYYHRLNTSQQEDVLIYESPQNLIVFSFTIVEKRYLALIAKDFRTFTTTGFFYKDLFEPNSDVLELFNDLGFDYEFVGKIEEKIFVKTNKNGSLGSIMSIDLFQPQNAQIIIEESSSFLDSALLIKNCLVCKYNQNGCPEIHVFSLAGEHLYEIPLPKKICDIEMDSYFETQIWFKISSFDSPPAIYRFDLNTHLLELVHQPPISLPNDLEIEQVLYPGKDGKPLILFICHQKGVALDGDNPTLLRGYGGYGNTTIVGPYYWILHRAWLEMGGILCTAMIRGDGIYGIEPHLPLARPRQQTIDDFISAAEWLIEKKYTSKNHLGIMGASFGGWLMGACMNQRPDLFKAVVIGNGILDLLRVPYYTIGQLWFPLPPWEKDFFLSLYRLSPYHNIQKETKYPAIFEVLGDHDERVVPFHGFKHIAALQEANQGELPILLHVARNQGHSWVSSTSLEPLSMLLAFFWQNLKEDLIPFITHSNLQASGM